MTTKHDLTHLDLFSGIGGFALAAEWGGVRTVGFSEVEPYACRVLAERWSGVPNVGDVRIAANFARFRGVTVLTGGFPCQPWSAAGKRGGTGDDRHLWPAMLDVIKTVGPAWIIGENVPGLDHMGQLDACCDDLARLGYESQPFEIPACAVDAPHLRDRLWIVANASGGRCGRSGEGEDEQPRRAETVGGSEDVADANQGGIRCTGPSRQSGHTALGGEALADAARLQQGRQEQRAERERIGVGGESFPIPDASDGQQDGGRDRLRRGHRLAGDDRQNPRRPGREGFDRWLPESGILRVAHGIPRRVDRLKGLGNAIVPQVAAPFFEWIAQIETEGLTP